MLKLHPADTPVFRSEIIGYYTLEQSGLVQGLTFHGRRSLIVPVPLQPKCERGRGFNQSELLFRSLARRIGAPCHHCPLRVRAMLPQVGLTDSMRQENVRKASRCCESAMIEGRRSLLADDVRTTGVTVSSAAQSLMKSGALRVSVLTVARPGRRSCPESSEKA